MYRKKPGFTLLELILSLLIIITLLGIAIFMFTKGNKDFNNSDVRSTLQIEGQKIQDKISDIGMKASEIEMVFPDKESGEIDYIIIKSHEEDNGFSVYFKIQKNGEKLIISKDISMSFSNSSNSEIISENIDNLSITKNSNDKSINFDINLKKSNGAIDAINHKFNFTIYITK